MGIGEASATEKVTDQVSPDETTKSNNSDAGDVQKVAAVVENEKEIMPAEPVPKWTLMKTLKQRASKGMGSSAMKGADATARKGKGTEGAVGDPLHEVTSDDGLLSPGEQAGRGLAGINPGNEGASGAGDAGVERTASGRVVEYKVYKRRWFGLVQLVLLNIVVSWDWLSFSANSTTVSQYYNVSESVVNWLSTAFMFAFLVSCPCTIYVLHHGGPKQSIIVASVLLFVGNWVRYGATKAGTHGNYGGVMFGQILTGLAQPFVLAAPTRYSDLWFTNRGRVTATAVMSLANPFGGALAQLIDPFWAGNPGDIPNMILYISIIATIASIPSFFVPASPPTPSSASWETAKQPLLPSLKFLFTSPEFYMIMLPYTVYVGLFNSISSLINQILAPYSFSETDAGIAGALLIVVGLVAAAISSPIIDRTKTFILAIKVQVPIIAICYLAFTFAPGSRSLGAVYAILSILGAASFSLVPVVLEFVIEITHPVSPEVTSVICWAGGQLFGGCFILISDALRDPGVSDGTADDGTKRPPGNMYRALIFQTVMALVVVPLPLALGLFGRKKKIEMRRIEADKEAPGTRDEEGGGGGVVP